MARHAVIHKETKKVMNVIEWDGVAQWSPPENHYTVESNMVDRNDTHLPEHDCFKKFSNGKIYHRHFDSEKMKAGEECPIGSKVQA